jgi:hypothetical protein
VLAAYPLYANLGASPGLATRALLRSLETHKWGRRKAIKRVYPHPIGKLLTPCVVTTTRPCPIGKTANNFFSWVLLCPVPVCPRLVPVLSRRCAPKAASMSCLAVFNLKNPCPPHFADRKCPVTAAWNDPSPVTQATSGFFSAPELFFSGWSQFCGPCQPLSLTLFWGGTNSE